MSAIRIAQRYAKSLIDLAHEQDSLEATFKDVTTVMDAVNENRELLLMLKSPVIKEDKKKSILNEIFAEKIGELTTEFMKIVVDKRREEYLPEIMAAFEEQYNEYKGITPVKVISASPLSEENIEKIRRMVKEKFGKKTLDLTMEVDPELIGGFMLKFEDKLYDASIVHQLEEIRQEFNKNQFIKSI